MSENIFQNIFHHQIIQNVSVRIVQSEQYGKLKNMIHYHSKYKLNISFKEKNQSLKEFQLELKITSDSGLTIKDAKQTVCLLARDHGIKSPEDFGVLVCHYFMTNHDHVVDVCLISEDFAWNQIATDVDEHKNGFSGIKQSFIHIPEAIRSSEVKLTRKGL